MEKMYNDNNIVTYWETHRLENNITVIKNLNYMIRVMHRKSALKKVKILLIKKGKLVHNTF